MPTVLPTPEAPGPNPGQPGHYAHHDWLTSSVHALDNAQSALRPIPYAIAAGQTNVVFSAATAGSAAFTYPVGRFTQIPVTTMGIDNAGPSTLYQGRLTPHSAAGGTVNISSAVSTSGTAQVGWIAVQMSSGAAPGVLAADESWPTFDATCHTDGCGNAEHAIALQYDPESPPDAVFCGVCGQPITDTTALEGNPA